MTNPKHHTAGEPAELARRAELFEGIFNNMPNGVAVYKAVDDGEDFIFTDFNPAAEHIDQIRRQDVIGRRVSEVFPGIRSLGLFEVFQRVWRTGEAERHPMGRYKDDRLLGWRLNVVFKLSSNEIVTIYSDETGRRSLELEHERLVAELKARNQELERFTYTVSHDLKSPLVTIQGFIGLLTQDLTENDHAAAKSDIERITRAAKTMQKLLENLLELSRAGRFVGPVRSISMSKAATEALDMLAGRLAERKARVEISPDLPKVMGDHMRLRQLLQNLLDNALKFTDDQKQPRVVVGVRQEAGGNVFFVKDNGRGIEPVYHHRIFDMFERLDGAAEGSGVGLALAKRIVEVHGGNLWVESEGIGRGSCFCFTLPVPSEQEAGCESRSE